MHLVFMKETPNMKKLNLSLAILALAAMSVNAQTATTDVVGYEVQNFNAGNTVHAVTFVKPNLFKGVASSKTANSLTVRSQE